MLPTVNGGICGFEVFLIPQTDGVRFLPLLLKGPSKILKGFSFPSSTCNVSSWGKIWIPRTQATPWWQLVFVGKMPSDVSSDFHGSLAKNSFQHGWGLGLGPDRYRNTMKHVSSCSAAGSLMVQHDGSRVHPDARGWSTTSRATRAPWSSAPQRKRTVPDAPQGTGDLKKMLGGS